jgi:hypothetical protein
MASKSKEAISCHCVLGFLNKGTCTQTLIKNSNDILAATFFIVDTINSVLSFVTKNSTSAVDSKRNQEQAADVIGTMYSTLPTKDGVIHIQDIVQTLGESKYVA